MPMLASTTRSSLAVSVGWCRSAARNVQYFSGARRSRSSKLSRYVTCRHCPYNIHATHMLRYMRCISSIHTTYSTYTLNIDCKIHGMQKWYGVELAMQHTCSMHATQGYQNEGRKVAFVGDGVNDVLAMRCGPKTLLLHMSLHMRALKELSGRGLKREQTQWPEEKRRRHGWLGVDGFAATAKRMWALWWRASPSTASSRSSHARLPTLSSSSRRSPRSSMYGPSVNLSHAAYMLHPDCIFACLLVSFRSASSGC